MATVDQPFQTENDQQQQNSQSSANSSIGQAPQISGGGNPSGGAGGVGGASAGAPGGASNAPKPSSSGAYPNLDKYMQANANWNSSQGGLGGEIASNLNQQGQQLNQQTQNASSAFNNQGNNWESNTNQANQSFQSGLGFNNGNTQGSENLSNISPYFQNGANNQEANTALNAQYNGPQNIAQSNSSLQQQVQNYNDTARQGQTEGGQFNLLRQMFNRPNYTQGQQQLDQLFLQAPNQQQQLQGAAQTAQKTNQAFNTANVSSQQQANNWQNFANQTRASAANALNTAVGNENSQIQNEYQNALSQQNTNFNNLTNALNSGNITQQQANNLGLNSMIGQNIYNTNLGNYLSKANLNAANTATTQDYATIAALSKLAQMNTSAIAAPSSQVLSQYQAAPGQLYNSSNDINFNNTQAQEAVQNAAQNYEQAIGNNVATANQNLEWNPYNPQAQNGNIISNPANLQGLTFAQLGLGNATPTPQQIAGDYRMQAGYNDLNNWLVQNNYATMQAVPLTAAQQAQMSALQTQLNSYEKEPNNDPEAIRTLENDIGQLQQNNGQYAQLNSNGLKASPLDFFKQVLSGQDPNLTSQQLQNDWSMWAPGMQQGIGALQNIINANNTYTPTRELQITPNGQ